MKKREKLAQQIIEEKYNTENQPPLMDAYEQDFSAAMKFLFLFDLLLNRILFSRNK